MAGKIRKKEIKKKGRDRKRADKKISGKIGLFDFIYNNFLISLKDVRKNKNYIFFSVTLFLLIALIGYIFPIFFIDIIMKTIEELVKKTEGLGVFALISFIMYNNIQSSFVSIIFGIFLSITPLAVIVVNGYVLGFVANKTVGIGGIGVLWRLLPHGIFEIPAIMIAVSFGIKIGISLVNDCVSFYRKGISKSLLYLLTVLSIIFFIIAFPVIIALTLSNNYLRKKFFENLLSSIRAFILVIVPLLVIAAIIEGILIIALA